MLVERDGPDGTTRVLIDSSPDLRAQLLDAGIGVLNGVAYTHQHADHVHGLDDLRMIVFNTRERLPIWADDATREALTNRFGYAFFQPEWSSYPPILKLNRIEGPFTVDGPGGSIELSPFRAVHGDIHALGFRIGPLAYLPDVSEMTDEAWQAVTGIDCWVVDALRRSPHPSHAHLDRTLEWIDRAKPGRAILTNMHIDLDYATVDAETPEHVTPAHDGLVLRYEV